MKASIIEYLLDALDGQSGLAKAAGVSQPAVHKWVHGKSRPGHEACIAIEAATSGRVSRFDLRPDIFGSADGLGFEPEEANTAAA